MTENPIEEKLRQKCLTKRYESDLQKELRMNIDFELKKLEKEKQKNQLLKNFSSEAQTLKSLLKKSNESEDKRKRKRVSFLMNKCRKKVKRKSDRTNQKLNKFSFHNNCIDSDDEQLIIDFSNESDVSVSDSYDSWDEMHDSLAQHKKLSQSEKMIARTDSHFNKSCEEEKGDPSRVIEITISEDEDETEVIQPQSHIKQQILAQISDKNFDIKEDSINSDSICQKSEDKPSLNLKTNETVEKNAVKPIINEIVTKVIDNCFASDVNPFDHLIGYNIELFQTMKYCVFCETQMKSSEEALDHYLSHCGVYIECKECHLKFSSLQSFRGHDSNHLDRNNMLYLEQFMDAKKWCDNYVKYIEKRDDIVKQVKNVSQIFCPVCHQMSRLFNINGFSDKPQNSEQLLLNEELIIDHLHQHLQYFPFECIDCSFVDKKTAFCLNQKARQHLIEVHNIKNANQLKVNELKSYFNKVKGITKLDNVIDNSFNLSLKMKSFHEKFAFMSKKQT